MSGWIGVDFDGTLAEYHGWVSERHAGPPIPAMVARVKRWLDEGKEVRILTARVSGPPDDAVAARETIAAWCKEHIGQELPVTSRKDYAMAELWDDRCVQVEPNTGKAVSDEIERLREELRESDAEVVALALRNNTLRTKLDKALGWIERLIPYDDPDSWEGLAKLRGGGVMTVVDHDAVIEGLEAEIDRLRGERDRYRDWHDDQVLARGKLADENASLRGES